MENTEKNKNPYFQKIEFLSNDFKIRVKDDSPWIAEKAIHEEIEIKYYEGECALMIGSDIILTKPGDITVVNPYEIHTNINIDKYAGRYTIMVIGIDFLDSVNRNVLNLRRILIEQGGKFDNLIRGDKRLQAIVARVVEEMRNEGAYYKLIVQNLISEFFALLIRDHFRSGDEILKDVSDVKQVKLISPALAKIHTEYFKVISVDELAELCNISKYHFCRVFKNVMGVTAVRYMNGYRVDIAETLLRDGRMTVAEVAWHCGFEDDSYFYRCYKKIKGIPPGKVRKK